VTDLIHRIDLRIESAALTFPVPHIEFVESVMNPRRKAEHAALPDKPGFRPSLFGS